MNKNCQYQMLANMFRATETFQTLLVEIQNVTATMGTVLQFLVKLTYTNYILQQSYCSVFTLEKWKFTSI